MAKTNYSYEKKQKEIAKQKKKKDKLLKKQDRSQEEVQTEQAPEGDSTEA
jgi:hypothetical protein